MTNARRSRVEVRRRRISATPWGRTPAPMAWLVAAAVSALALGSVPLAAQGPSMGSTLRYGSGLLDVPVSSVLAHRKVRATYSGFWSDLDRRVRIDQGGSEDGYDPGGSSYFADGSLAVGLFGRGEAGVTLQSLGDAEQGGAMWGFFGRLEALEPVDQGLGLAFGGRFVTRPDFGDGTERAPGRLGFADSRLRRSPEGSDRAMDTRLTLYGVASAYLRGFDGLRVPENDLVLSLGWGTGMFRGSSVPDLYGEGSNGWFAGVSSHWRVTDESVVQVMAEHNGFDVNVGVQAEWSGARLGVHVLGANHPRPQGGYASEYRSPKVGLSASFALCLDQPRFRCRSGLMPRLEPDTIWIPPPPPDTVRIFEARPAPPEGEPVSICLSTGQNVSVSVSAAGDTLVGPAGTPIEELRPVVDFAGSYAAGALWFERGEDILFEGLRFYPSGAPFSMDCEQVLRVGLYQGVPVFADRAVIRPLDVLFIPARVGLWQRYVAGVEVAAGSGRRRTGSFLRRTLPAEVPQASGRGYAGGVGRAAPDIHRRD